MMTELHTLRCSQCAAPIAFATVPFPAISCMCRVCADAYAQVATAVGVQVSVPEMEIHNKFLTAFDWRHNVEENLAITEMVYKPITFNLRGKGNETD